MLKFLKSLFASGVAGIEASEANRLLRGNRPPYILDVREPSEFRAGHIDGATLIPLNSLANRIQQIPKDREILCVCQSGMRSSSAARQLAAAGYRVMNLRGGMSAWSAAQLPVRRGS